jgi:hypothetical protein
MEVMRQDAPQRPAQKLLMFCLPLRWHALPYEEKKRSRPMTPTPG